MIHYRLDTKEKTSKIQDEGLALLTIDEFASENPLHLISTQRNGAHYLETKDQTILSFQVFTFSNNNLQIIPVAFILRKKQLVIGTDLGGIEHHIKEFMDNYSHPLTPERLLFGVLDSLIKQMITSLDKLDEAIMSLEEIVLGAPHASIITSLVNLKNNCFKTKRITQKLFFIKDGLSLNENKHLSTKMLPLLDNFNHQTNRLHNFADSLYAEADHLMELHNSQVATRTNNTINRLTVFTVLATPITVVSGIYGMNFHNMPGIDSPHGYFIVIGVTFLISSIVYILLKRSRLL